MPVCFAHARARAQVHARAHACASCGWLTVTLPPHLPACRRAEALEGLGRSVEALDAFESAERSAAAPGVRARARAVVEARRRRVELAGQAQQPHCGALVPGPDSQTRSRTESCSITSEDEEGVGYVQEVGRAAGALREAGGLGSYHGTRRVARSGA